MVAIKERAFSSRRSSQVDLTTANGSRTPEKMSSVGKRLTKPSATRRDFLVDSVASIGRSGSSGKSYRSPYGFGSPAGTPTKQKTIRAVVDPDETDEEM